MCVWYDTCMCLWYVCILYVCVVCLGGQVGSQKALQERWSETWWDVSEGGGGEEL